MDVPELRFPAFNGECKNKKLEEYSIFIRDGTHGSFKDQSNGIPLLSAKDIDSGKIVLNNNPRTISLEDYNSIHKNYEITIDDILLTIVGSIGRSAIVSTNKRFTLQRSVAIIRANKEINSLYLNYYFHSDNFQKSLRRATSSSAQGGVYLKSLNKMNVNLHEDAKEQEKIASFLSKVDEKIEKLEKKQELWETYKKGMMQQIFSQNLRFKDENGEDYPDWEERKFSEILFEHKKKSTENEEVFSVSVHKGLINQVEHLGRTFAAKDTSKYNLVKYGDIVYTKSPTGKFPLGIIKQSKINQDVLVSPLYGVFSPETTHLGLILDAHFESPVNTKNYLNPIVQKGAKNTMNITNTTFLSRSLVLPYDKKEQEKIAKLIEYINKKIIKINQELEINQAFKKGLLQQMFC